MPINIAKFFDLGRLFDLRPTIDLKTVYFLLAVFGILVMAAAAVKLWQKSQKRENFIGKLFDKYFTLLLTMGLLGWLLVLFRYDNAYLLGARFWLLIWLLTLIIWLAFILKYQLKIVPPARKRLEQKKMFEKYLPKKK